MLVATQMSPATPLKREPQQLSSPSRSSPLRSSPLNPEYRHSNPPSHRRASANNHFHVQSRYIRPSTGSSTIPSPFGASGSDSNPQKALWREQFRKKCADRAQRDREKHRNATRAKGSAAGFGDSSEGDLDDFDLDDDEGVDDPVSVLSPCCLTSGGSCWTCVSDEGRFFPSCQLYGLLAKEERRKFNYRQKVSYQYAVGSSIDPAMEDFDEYERHFAEDNTMAQAEEEIPDDIDVEISLPDDYAPSESAYEGDSQLNDMDFEFSSPPASPSSSRQVPASKVREDNLPFVSALLASPCPYCRAPFSLHASREAEQPALECAVCQNSFFLRSSADSWAHSHPTPLQYVHPHVACTFLVSILPYLIFTSPYLVIDHTIP